MRFKLILLTITFNLFFSYAYAHQEIVLRYSEDKIEGLPNRYNNVSIKWDSGELSINDNQLKFPHFIVDVLKADRFYTEKGDLAFKVGVIWTLMIMGNWSDDQHEEGDFPDYLKFDFHPANKDYYISIIFDLEKPALVGTCVILTTFSKENGDVWISNNSRDVDAIESTEMELVIELETESVWQKYKNSMRPSSGQNATPSNTGPP